MRHMGNSGKLAIIAAVVSAGLLVLLAITLEEMVMYGFLGVLAIGYLACVTEVITRRRYFTLLLGAAGLVAFIAFGIAFLRMWGLAFNQDENALGSAVSTKDSDIYFYVAVLAGCGSLFVLFVGAVWPSRGVFRNRAGKSQLRKKRPTSGSRTAARPAPRPGARPGAGGARPASGAARPASGAARPAAAGSRTAQRPVARPTTGTGRPTTGAKRPASGSGAQGISAQRKPAPKR